jgi:hypothetical protein
VQSPPSADADSREERVVRTIRMSPRRSSITTVVYTCGRLTDAEEQAVQGRRIVTGVAAAMMAAGLVGLTGPSAQAAPSPHTASNSSNNGSNDSRTSISNPGVLTRAVMSANGFQALIDSITQQVRAEHPHATFQDAIGTSPSGPTTSITDVPRWDFLFNDVGGEGDGIIVKASIDLPSPMVLINVQHNATVYSKPLVGPVAMSPFQATLWRRLAGYPTPFTKVVYVQPNRLMAPRSFPNPVFLFYEGTETPTTIVDTVTRTVEPWGA